MALSNAQYDELMRTYEQRQLDNEHALRKRYETARSMIPELSALDDAISSSASERHVYYWTDTRTHLVN